jgi:hypothetical protein
VLILKENRTFDEVLGDVKTPGDAPAAALAFPSLARFGMHGRASGGKTQFSVQDATITPNQHGIAQRWAFSDNFYVDGDTKADGELWLEGGYPDLISGTGILASHDSPPARNVSEHLQRAGVNLRYFDEGWNTGLSDQTRADRFIAEIDRQYRTSGGDLLPRFILIRLPNDRTGEPKPQSAYPYDASYVEDNDLATGRILDYLSHSPWWRNMVVFATETDTQGSLDHIDSHRTLLFAAGPYVKRNYVSHTNASFPGLWRTIFELLRVPPLNLMDATAATVRDMFTEQPDFAPFDAIQPDHRIFDPAKLSTPAH